MSRSSPVFVCRDLVKRWGAGAAGFELRVPELTIGRGEVALLKGPSGCGKSTLLDLLALALRPDGAEAFIFRPAHRAPTDLLGRWQREDLDGLGQLRGSHIGYVLQTGGLLSFLTARENIALPCRLLGQVSAGGLERLAERLGIAAHLDKRPDQLSVGERQRVAIARAMIHSPDVILADEPTASVDPVNAGAILELLLTLVQHTGVTTVIASHNWEPNGLPAVRVVNHRMEREGELIRSYFWS
jgi:putative ABC transport system ATP-binding protein